MIPFPPQLTVYNVPAAAAAGYLTFPLIVRVTTADDIRILHELPLSHIVWCETTLELAESAAWPDEVALDAVMENPREGAPRLYSLARKHPDGRLRITIPVREGASRAGALGVALHLPIRLLPSQPDRLQIAEMEKVLERYLHDPQATQPVEFFHSALAAFLHEAPTTIWAALEQEPAVYKRIPSPGETIQPLPENPSHFAASQSECLACPFLAWCSGYFKWPDPGYSCHMVRPFLQEIQSAALQIKRDLAAFQQQQEQQ